VIFVYKNRFLYRIFAVSFETNNLILKINKNMKILVINSGSSSLKFQLFEMPQAEVLVKGLAERIGEETGRFKANDYEVELPIPTHKEALELLTDYLLNPAHNLIKDKNEIAVLDIYTILLFGT